MPTTTPTAAPTLTPVPCDGGSGLWIVKAYSDLEVSTGRRILFQYSAGHNLYRLNSQEAYESCDMTGATLIGSASAGGGSGSFPNAVRVAKEDGDMWFACGIGGHCQAGQKLKAVDVSTATSSSGGDALAVQRVTGTVSLLGLSREEFNSDPSIEEAMKATLAALASTNERTIMASQVTISTSSISSSNRRLLSTGVLITYTLECQSQSATDIASNLNSKMSIDGGLSAEFQQQALAKGCPNMVSSRTLTLTGTATPVTPPATDDSAGLPIIMIAGGAVGVFALVGLVIWWFYSGKDCKVVPIEVLGVYKIEDSALQKRGVKREGRLGIENRVEAQRPKRIDRIKQHVHVGVAPSQPLPPLKNSKSGDASKQGAEPRQKKKRPPGR